MAKFTRPSNAAACIVAAFLSLTLTGAFAQQADSAAPATQGWPSWLVEAMDKESRKLRASKVTIADGLIKTRLAGKATGKPQSIDGGWYLRRDIRTASPLECWAFTATVDPATVAANIAESSMLASEQTNGPLGDRQLYHVEAGSYDGAPFLALEWLYSVGEASKKLVGLAKVRVAVKRDVTFACAHNFVGYRATFAKIFDQFVREAVVDSVAPSPYYEEVVVQRIGDQTIGVSRSSFTLDAEGDTQITMLESSLVPVDVRVVSMLFL